ncbi:helix-turn-helix transcriptional regulator [Streptomyces sp. NPDC057877]|uniref:helix-turn-helix transcriptional regulator n=1 Tax=Streptomyces sp. NPDC057877 TaxID=3346269 RepID=UPI00367483E4
MTGPPPHTEHGPEEPCATGRALYERALREGRVSEADAAAAPCLLDFGLLQPSVTGLGHLEPVAPAVALHRLLSGSADRIAEERRREARLTEAYAPLLRTGTRAEAATDGSALTMLSGLPRINGVIGRAMATASHELLAIQPHSGQISISPEIHAEALARDQRLLDRGGRIRTLYQHTTRHLPRVLARYEQLAGDVEARTLDEVTERLIVIDRAVAFIPATPPDRTVAVEIRHPPLVAYLATTFDRLWRLATPMHPEAVRHPTTNGITHRQRAIAALLVEGHTDAVIAERLGMNVRTAREHIAKLSATLGSESRAQLGYLIGRSGILDQGR